MYITEKYRTATQWRSRGFLIRTGARSHVRDDYGTALFSRSQVHRISPRVVYVPTYW